MKRWFGSNGPPKAAYQQIPILLNQTIGGVASQIPRKRSSSGSGLSDSEALLPPNSRLGSTNNSRRNIYGCLEELGTGEGGSDDGLDENLSFQYCNNQHHCNRQEQEPIQMLDGTGGSCRCPTKSCSEGAGDGRVGTRGGDCNREEHGREVGMGGGGGRGSYILHLGNQHLCSRCCTALTPNGLISTSSSPLLSTPSPPPAPPSPCPSNALALTCPSTYYHFDMDSQPIRRPSTACNRHHHSTTTTTTPYPQMVLSNGSLLPNPDHHLPSFSRSASSVSNASHASSSGKRISISCWYCIKYSLCRQWWACCKRLPRRTIRTLQWCCGHSRKDLCLSICDMYSLVVSVLLLCIVLRNRMRSYCVGVRYSSDYICSEKYVSFECNFPVNDFLEDEELLMRCGVSSDPADVAPTIKPHSNDSIETNCGKPNVLAASMKSRTYTRNAQDEQGAQVPNIVHYTIDCSHNRNFTYINYLSLLSVEKFIKPDKIYIHCDCVLNTLWWIRALENISNIHVVEREFPEYIQSQPPRWQQHRQEVIRLQTLFHNGGIHLDPDVLIVRSFDRLRSYEAVIGQSGSQGHLDGSIILAKPHSPFICLWMNSYRDYNPWPWEQYKHSHANLRQLAARFPHHVHVEHQSLLQPGPGRINSLLYNGLYEWKFNFALKLWPPSEGFQLPEDEYDAKMLTSSLGDVIRHILREPDPKNIVSTTTARASSAKKKNIKANKKDKKETPKKNKNKHAKPTKPQKKQRLKVKDLPDEVEN